jgi:hypothetical protein
MTKPYGERISVVESMLLPVSRLLETIARKYRPLCLRQLFLLAVFGAITCSNLYCQDLATDPESYKIRVVGQFWYATPTASIAGSSSEVPISFDQVIGFQQYSTFNAFLDWHFKRKHHLTFAVSPNQTTRSAVLKQNITFRDTTFLAGSSVTGELHNYSFAPGYRYDIIHNPRGHFGILVQIDLLDFKASITGTVLQSEQTNSTTASGSLFAPLPVAGPDGRFYFAKNHVYVDANLKGMYFFGYGNFIATAGTVGVRLGNHVDVVGGYELGSHLAIHGTNSRLDVRQTQHGPTAGLAFNF